MMTHGKVFKYNYIFNSTDLMVAEHFMKAYRARNFTTWYTAKAMLLGVHKKEFTFAQYNALNKLLDDYTEEQVKKGRDDRNYRRMYDHLANNF